MQGLDNRWRKSSYSGGNGGNCVEVADHDEMILVRDTKNREHGHLTIAATDSESGRGAAVSPIGAEADIAAVEAGAALAGAACTLKGRAVAAISARI